MQNWKIAKIATTKSQRKLFFKLRSSSQRLSWLTESEIKSIAKDLKVAPDDVREMEARLTMKDASFDHKTSDDEVELFLPSQLFD